MKIYFSSLAIILILMIFSCDVSNQKQVIDMTPHWDSLRVIENPHKGWYHHMLDNGIHKFLIQHDEDFYSFPGMDHLYLRLCWAFLEPEEGDFDWSYIDNIAEKYVPMGYGISFRISCKETGGAPGSVPQEIDGVRYATPYWVKQAGAKGIDCPEYGEKCSWTPDWDDPIFLEKLDNFHKAFAEKYDGKPWVRYVDVGSIGEWGEGHTHFSTRIPPTVDEVKTHIDLYLKHYKNSQIIVTDDLIYYGKDDTEVDELFRYVKSNEIGFRDDSPLVNWYVKNNLKTFSVSHPHFFEETYKITPTILELQHYHTIKEDGNWRGKDGKEIIPGKNISGADIFRGAIKTLHATYIGYHGNMQDWHEENPELTKKLLNLTGYWYFVHNVELPEKAEAGSEQKIAVTWENKGVAPAYNSYQLHIKFSNENDEKVIVIDDSFNMEWLDGETKKKSYNVYLPNELNPGNYEVSIKLYDSSTEQNIELALKKSIQDNNGFFKVVTVEVK